MPSKYIFSLKHDRLPASAGGKAYYLRSLLEKGFPVPETFVCTWQAYERFLDSDDALRKDLKVELTKNLDLEKSYAVRSSANIEDHVDHSFAGQFKSYLDINGLDAILDAIEKIWENTRSPEVITYFDRSSIKKPEILMGVLIQEMVNPKISGVSFSKNPITGLDEIIVEAISGNGTAIVQGGATPERWINKWGEYISLPENTSIDLDLINQVVEHTKTISKYFGKPADLEWIFDGATVYWLQLREISSLENINYYSRKIAQGMLPGMIKPLIWSISVPMVIGAKLRLLTEIIGPNEIDPFSLAKSFYYRAYFNMGRIGDLLELLGLPRESFELMMGVEVAGPEKPKFKPSPRTLRFLPGMMAVAFRLLFSSKRIEQFYINMDQIYRAMQIDKFEQLSEEELLAQIDDLFELNQETAYRNFTTQILMRIYNILLNNQLEKIGVDYASFDIVHDSGEMHDIDPRISLNELAEQYLKLSEDQKKLVSQSDYQEFMDLIDCESLQQGVNQFIVKFGHLSDSGSDFSYPPWRENPDLILNMIQTYAETEHTIASKISFDEVKRSGKSGPVLNLLYPLARKYFIYREQLGSLYTYGNGLFRNLFLTLGDKLTLRNVIRYKSDIFYLSFDEIKSIVTQPESSLLYTDEVEMRKVEMDTFRDITPPAAIFGDQPVPIDVHAENILQGTATSRGHHQGPAKVVRGIQDCENINAGDVLVVPYSDVGWTPLYAKAGAVVAESGGMLSHSSIVAREYGIPAVVSVPSACNLLVDKIVTVDGNNARVIIHEE